MKARKLMKMPVINYMTGQVVGHIADLVIGHDRKLMGLMVEIEKAGTVMIPAGHFIFSERGVLVNEDAGLKNQESGEYWIKYSETVGSPVWTANGREEGVVSDLILQPEEQAVEGIEVSDGLFNDLINGRREVPWDKLKTCNFINPVIEKQGG